MISINSNLGSMIVQNSLNKATLGLNNATERMTTGYKINHAKDNAANYSINTNLSTKISSFLVAEDNVAMGLDLLTTASDSLNQIDDKLARLRALAEQAANGTYGEDSLKAINSEANAIVDEIERLYNTTSYNGISLFKGESSVAPIATRMMARTMAVAEPTAESDMPVANPTTGFIAEVDYQEPEIVVTRPEDLASAISSNSIIGISDADGKGAETLAELATLVNSGTTCSDKTIVLTSDIDLGAWCSAHTEADGTGGWTPIGTRSNKFQGNFNGNGYKISNLCINRPTEDCQGLFGSVSFGIIKNIGLENFDVIGNNHVGGLAGHDSGTNITNNYATGDVTGNGDYTGGLIGQAADDYRSISNCYATGDVTGNGDYTGGLIGE